MKTVIAVFLTAAIAVANTSAADAGPFRDAARKIAETAGVAVLAGGIVARCALIKLRPGGLGTC